MYTLRTYVEGHIKGMFSGTYNAVSGKVKKHDNTEVGEVGGTWSQSMYFRPAKVRLFLQVTLV